MKRLTTIALAVGLGLLTGLLIWRGWPAIQALHEHAGLGLAWLAIYYTLPLLFAAGSWWWLFPPRQGPRALHATYATWVGLAVNWLLPVAQIGGELVKTWLVVDRGAATDSALASAVVDKTVQVATQVVFTIVGLALLSAHYAPGNLIVGTVAGMGALAVGTLLFYRLQQRGMFQLSARILERFLSSARADRINANAQAVDEAVRAAYRRRTRLMAAFALRLAFRFVLVGEIMLAAWLLGMELTLLDALVIESLVQAARAGAFLIPGGLGAQDGALVVLGLALGLPAEGALAIALCKRVRELLVGLPALGLWQLEHHRRAVVG